MHNVKIINVSENVYRVSGTTTALETYHKSAVVDGETYHKTWREEVVYDIDKLWEEKGKKAHDGWYCTTINDFVFLGVPEIKLWNLQNAFYFVRTGGNIRSDNDFVNMCQLLSELNIIPFKVYAGKLSDRYRKLKDGLEVVVYSYGFNNHLHVVLKYSDILSLNLDSKYLPYRWEEDDKLFPKGWQKYSDIQKNDLLINYINIYDCTTDILP